jgi:hypothetical protein
MDNGCDGPRQVHGHGYDATRDRFYVAAEDKLLQLQNGTWTTLPTPRTSFGSVRVTTVAVDPVSTFGGLSPWAIERFMPTTPRFSLDGCRGRRGATLR